MTRCVTTGIAARRVPAVAAAAWQRPVGGFALRGDLFELAADGSPGDKHPWLVLVVPDGATFEQVSVRRGGAPVGTVRGLVGVVPDRQVFADAVLGVANEHGWLGDVAGVGRDGTVSRFTNRDGGIVSGESMRTWLVHVVRIDFIASVIATLRDFATSPTERERQRLLALIQEAPQGYELITSDPRVRLLIPGLEKGDLQFRRTDNTALVSVFQYVIGTVIAERLDHRGSTAVGGLWPRKRGQSAAPLDVRRIHSDLHSALYESLAYQLAGQEHPVRRCQAPGCGESMPGTRRRKYHDAACRKRAQRARQIREDITCEGTSAGAPRTPGS